MGGGTTNFVQELCSILAIGRMWSTFYGHSAYIQKTLVTCQGEAQILEPFKIW